MAPALAVSLKTQFWVLKVLPDERTHSEPARFCSLTLSLPTMMAALTCALLCMQRSDVWVFAEATKPPGARRRRRKTR